MLGDFLTLNLFQLLLVFARVGTAVMLLPGVGEVTIAARVRLSFALALSVIVLPVVADRLPVAPDLPAALALLLGGEIFLGFAVGMMARILIAALQVAGTIIAYHSGMGTALLFDPTAGQQGAMIGAFLTTLGVTLLFVTGLHQVLIVGIVDSYAAMPPAVGPPVGELAEVATRFVAVSFEIGLKLAMPAVIVAFLLLMAMGLMARLMPQVHIFFVALPLQIGLGLLALALTLGAGMLVFLTDFEELLGALWRS